MRERENDNSLLQYQRNLLKVVFLGGTHVRDAPGVLGCERASLSGRLINRRVDRWPRSSAHGPCSPQPSEKMNTCVKKKKHGRPPNVSKPAKLDRRHKIEVTLIDYLELICIFGSYYGRSVTGLTGRAVHVGGP